MINKLNKIRVPGSCDLAFTGIFHQVSFILFLLPLALPGLIGCAGKKAAGVQPYVQSLPHRIAILPFKSSNPYIPGATLCDYFIVQVLQDNLGIQVIERKDLMKALQEQRLTLTGIVRQEKYTKLGSILGVDAVLIGSVQTLKTIQSVHGSISVTLKLMEVSTGRILWADRQTVSHATWSVREVSEIASILMQKTAKKMVKRLNKSTVLQNFKSVRAYEDATLIKEAKLRSSFTR